MVKNERFTLVFSKLKRSVKKIMEELLPGIQKLIRDFFEP
jgi:hypothetical protein